jgi:hypothetical protein
LCRKRTKKTTTKVGRKKAKAAATAAEATTPRTRAALKKEAAEKARREAEEAELRAAEAREAAKRATREEAQAADEVIEAMALQVWRPDPPTEPTTARKYTSSSTNTKINVRFNLDNSPSLIKLYFTKVLICIRSTRCTASSSESNQDDSQEEGVGN